MEELFRSIAGYVALGIEAAAIVLITIGAIEAFGRSMQWLAAGRRGGQIGLGRKAIWSRFAVWLLLGLEFELAADVVRTAISPTWNAIGQLGAIAAIRTVLNYFLERDIAESGEGAGS